MIGGRFSLAKSGMLRFTRRATMPMLPLLLQEIHAESPHVAVDFDGVGEVDAAGFVENLPPPLVQQRGAKPHHFGVVDRPAVHRPQRSVHANIRRPADFQMQIAPFQLHQRAEQLVDFQIRIAWQRSARRRDRPASSSIAGDDF